MNATTGTLAPEIQRFAAAVRYALGDLPIDEVDDLTDGLEAELEDRLDDLGPTALGDPDAYADELRSAAGLPPRGPRMPEIAPRVSPWATVAKFPSMIAAEFRGAAERHPRLGQLGAFFLALRPLWWVLRAATVYAILTGLMGWWAFSIDPTRAAIFLGLLVLSVQWGRGRWLPQSWMRVLFTVANVVIVIALPFFLGAAVNSINNAYGAYNYGSSDYYESPQDGIYRNGTPVDNVFAYGPDGDCSRTCACSIRTATRSTSTARMCAPRDSGPARAPATSSCRTTMYPDLRDGTSTR